MVRMMRFCVLQHSSFLELAGSLAPEATVDRHIGQQISHPMEATVAIFIIIM
jgi:hypothetical protein